MILTFMEKQWIDNLRKRFDNREAAPPDGLWEAVEAAMKAENAGGKALELGRKPTCRPVIWLRRVVAVAACLAVLFGAGWFLLRHDGRPQTAYSGMAGTHKPLHGTAGDVVHAVDGGSGMSSVDYAFAPVADVSVVDAVLPLGGDSSKTEPTDSSLVAPVAADNGKTVANKARPSLRDNIVVPDNRNHRRVGSHDDTGLLAMSGRGGGNGRGFSVALYGSGMASFGNAPGGGSASIMPYNLMRDQVVGNDVMLLSVPFDAGDEGNEVRVKHRQPVRVGASVRFRLGGRFGLETGVNYSYHSSDISSGDDDGGYKTEQRLHFVGVPVAVSYDIWHTDYLEIYASAGGSVEFCVSGKSHTDYFQDGRVTRGIDADMRDTRPQWSVNAAAGVQYNFIDMLGVYVEPGVGYYFDNGSGVNTIYKDKPFNFNLNLGLRLTIK